MIPVMINEGNFIIKNVDYNELKNICDCLNETEENLVDLGAASIFTFSDIEQRYLETLVNSLEYFCGIFCDNKLIGIIKGRIENKEVSELWILSLVIYKEYRSRKIGSKVINCLEEYFLENFNIKTFYALVTSSNKNSEDFWEYNSYHFVRNTNSLYSSKDKTNMKIYEKRR